MRKPIILAFLLVSSTLSAEEVNPSIIDIYGEEAIIENAKSYSQSSVMRMPLSEKDCHFPGDEFKDGACYMKNTNIITIGQKPDSEKDTYTVLVSNMGFTGNFCETSFEVKRVGNIFKPKTSLMEGYSISLELVDNKLTVDESWDWDNGYGQNSSPGCGNNAWISGNGSPFIAK